MLTQPLRDEHRELLPHIEALRTAADSVSEVSLELLEEHLDQATQFLKHHLIPHAQAEERALYPLVARLMGAPQATATMSRDHIEVGKLTEELVTLRSALSGKLNASQAKSLRRVLYGLYALVKVHFAKEEEIYLPLLEAKLTPDQAKDMFKAMEDAAAEAKSHPVA